MYSTAIPSRRELLRIALTRLTMNTENTRTGQLPISVSIRSAYCEGPSLVAYPAGGCHTFAGSLSTQMDLLQIDSVKFLLQLVLLACKVGSTVGVGRTCSLEYHVHRRNSSATTEINMAVL